MTKFCTNCGQEIDGRRNKCTFCGKELKNNKVINSNEKSKVKIESNVGKSRMLSAIVAILFGYLGVHNFYLGYNSKGIAQLLITLLTFGSLSFVSTIWGYCDAFMLFTKKINVDGYGNPLSR